MRTVTFLGLTAIADAIRKDWMPDSVVNFAIIILICAIFMDIIEFKHKIKTK